MLNLISLSLAMYPWFNDAEKVNNLKKCTISGNIIEINIIYDYDYSITNCDIIDLLVRGEEGLYNVRGHKPKSLNGSACTIKENYYSNFIFYKAPLLKIGDNVDFLIDKDIYDIISGEKILNGEYNFSYYYSSSGNFEICEPNVGEDTELQKKIRDGHKYLNELYDKKPKLVKSLLEPLRQAILSDKLELEIRNLASAFWKIVYNF